MSNDYRAEILELMSSDKSKEWTTQELTETLFNCQKKDDTVYKKYVYDVAESMQKLSRKRVVSKERIDTGHGYQICKWRLNL